MKSFFRRRLLTSTLFVSAIAAAAPAYAQVTEPVEAAPDAQDDVGEVTVTGSRISRPDLEVASPVNVIGAEEIALRQPNSAEDLLRELPSVRPSLGPAVNNGSDGSASVNLRGIGDNRTLVILDGRRIVPFGLDGVVDLNVIPLGLVERVDVVTGGASSVYGADAVAGVVNFITRRNFSGLEASGNYRVSERGDAVQYRADILVGANLDDNRGNVVLGIGYGDRRPLLQTNRAISAFPISSVNGNFNGSTGAVPSIFQTSLFAPATPTSAGNPNGLPTAGFGSVIDPSTGSFRAATQADTFNTNIGTYFLTPLERFNIYAAGRYEVTEGLEFYTTAMFTRNKAELALAATGTFGNAFSLPLNNPFLQSTARSQLCAANGISIADCAAAAAVNTGLGRAVNVIPSRRFLENGPRGNPIESTMFQVQTGIRGDLFEGLKYDLSAQYGETSQNQARINWGSASKVQQALNAYRNAAGQAVCAVTTNNCVPLNLFGANGSITPDQLAFIDLDAQIRRLVKQSVVTGSISGDLFGLSSPFATSAIAFSIGGEYRKLTAQATPDAPSQIQGEVLGTGARTPPDFGTYNVKEAFGELIVPLIDGDFKAQIEAGIRYSDYSTTGTSTTWKAGGTIEPVQGFKFRGMYQKAVRSPNILELFQSPVQGLSNLSVDPCQGSTPTASRALCEATGAPVGSFGSISQPSSGQINVTTSGNPNLDVERATTYTLGGVIAPRFIPRFSFTVDYFNIKIKDLISAPTQNDILNGCYSTTLNSAQTPNGFCQLIVRNPLTGSLNGAGETPGVILGSSNLGRLETAGIDAGFAYSLPIGASALKFGFNGTWLDYYRVQVTPNAINRDCTGVYSTSCTNPRAEWRWNARVGYQLSMFDVSLLWNHVSSVKLEPFNAAAIQPLSTPQFGGPNPATVLDAFERIKAFDYFDLAIRVNASDNFELGLLVENLFDKQPPLVGAGVGGTAFNNGNTFPTIYDVVGRAFTVSAKAKF